MASPPEGAPIPWRICKNIYSILDGEGAARYPGRWNRLGQRVIYAAETFSGAMLEILVHANIGRPPKDQHAARILIPARMSMDSIAEDSIAPWEHPDREATREAGSAWYEAGRKGRRSAILLVPSIVARRERNFLINQDHPDFRHIRASAPEAVAWDPRLFRQ